MTLNLKLFKKKLKNIVFFPPFLSHVMRDWESDESTEMTYICQDKSLSFSPGTFKAKWLKWLGSTENNSEHWTFDRNHFEETEIEKGKNKLMMLFQDMSERGMNVAKLEKAQWKKTPLFWKVCDQRRQCDQKPTQKWYRNQQHSCTFWPTK